MTEKLPWPRVLVVDDEPGNIKIIKETIKEYCRVSAAVSGAIALEIATSEMPPDLILLDIVMPDMDGHEVCRRLKVHTRSKSIPLIFLTAKTSSEDETSGFKLGADDYITKPFNPMVVNARVKMHLELKQYRDQLEEKNRQLQKALDDIKQLSTIVPICAQCKKIRDDAGYWQQVEQFIATHLDARFTHGYCPECYQEQVRELRQYNERKGVKIGGGSS